MFFIDDFRLEDASSKNVVTTVKSIKYGVLSHYAIMAIFY